ncbi:MAG: vitamin B12 transporter [Alphaproteobacteria bacterium]|jgi:vitamin B12 transporter
MNYKFYPFVVSLTLIPNFAIAQNDSDINADIIVTASKIAQTADTVGSAVTVLDRETLLKRGDRSVADSLSRVTGISLSRNGGVGGTTNIRIRGADQSQILVLIDGIRVSDAATPARAFDFSTLLVSDIERIEVLKGNQSSLYGADAIGGVISITTHKRETGIGGTAFMEGGSFGTVHGGASLRGGNDNVTYGLSVNHLQNDGFSRRDNNKERDGNEVTHLRGNLGLDITDNLNIAFSGGYEQSDIEFDGFSSLNANTQKDFLYGQAQLTHYAFNDILKSQLFYRASETDRRNNNGLGSISHFEGTNQTIGYQGDIALFERDTLTLGADYNLEEAQNSIDNENKAYFVNYVKGIGDHITVTLGGRLDDHAQFGTQGTYRTSLAYNIPQTNSKIHTSYGTGFKAPALDQLFNPFYGNPNLNPEKSTGFDVGLTQKFFNNKVTADVTYFRTKIDHLITYNFLANQYDSNADNQANLRGIEFDLNANITETINIFGNYTFTDTEDNTTKLSLLRRPKHLFNVGTDFQIKDVSVTLLGKYTGKQRDNNAAFQQVYNDDFFTADAQASYDLTDKVALYGRVENIFDADYQENLTFNAPGVSAYGGIRLRY